MIRAALAVALASCAGCMSLARTGTQTVAISVNIPARVQFSTARGYATRHENALLDAPRSSERATLTVAPFDGRPPFSIEVTPHSDMGWHEAALLVLDSVLVAPVVIDAAISCAWAWPRLIEVDYPDTGAPRVETLWRQ